MIDYRTLNARTIRDCFPLPRVDDLLDRLWGCTVFSKMDLFQGYHQVEVLEEHRHKTAFLSKYGLYEFNVFTARTSKCARNVPTFNELDLCSVLRLVYSCVSGRHSRVFLVGKITRLAFVDCV